jgi:hypothetical protein
MATPFFSSPVLIMSVGLLRVLDQRDGATKQAMRFVFGRRL